MDFLPVLIPEKQGNKGGRHGIKKPLEGIRGVLEYDKSFEAYRTRL
jgi:hypothetical protein